MTLVRSSIRIAVVAAAVFGATLAAGQTKSKPALPQTYQQWLNRDVAAIITAKERDVFLALQTDRERDLFIEAFWRHRDPVPETPENEFKLEHYRRLAYATEYFGRDTTRPGWQTDRGRYYVLLGPPTNIVSIQSEGVVQPALIWYYDGKDQYGLPPHFQLVFFRRDGIGEYVLYSPLQDGPARLLVGTWDDPIDRMTPFLKLQRYDSRLADAAISMIPGESSIFLGQSPLASEQLLSRIATLPEKMVDGKYAEAMLKYKGFVDVEYSANYVPSDGLVSVIRDASGLFFVHYAIEIKRLSVLNQDGRFRLIFTINGNLTDTQGRTIFQYEKTIPLDFKKEEVEDIQKSSLEIQDMIPVTSGDFSLSLLMKNTISKEFTSLDGRVSIPAGTPVFGMGPLLLGYQRKSASVAADANKPFKVGADQILCQAGDIFHPKETLVVFFQLFGAPDDIRDRGTVKYAILKDDREVATSVQALRDGTGLDVISEIPLKTVPPGSYRLRVSVLDGAGRERAFQTKEFGVSSVADLPRPWIVSRVMPASDDPEYAYILGGQSAAAGRPAEASGYFATAFQKNPSMLKYALAYAQTFSTRDDFADAKRVLEPFLASAGSDDRLLFALAGVHQALGEYRDAVDLYQKYLSHAGVSVPVLNALGECHDRLGEFKDALSAFERSLELKPNQDAVRKRVEELRKKRCPGA